MKSITKDQFVAVLDAAGVNDAQKQKFHATFEEKYPEAHQSFLEFLNLVPAEIERIRARSRHR